jgi:cell division inhibitor SepF
MSNEFPSNVIGMPGVNNMVNEVVVIEPHSFDEIPQVIQTLKEQRSVVLNLNVMDPEEAQRAVDFVAGGTYAIDGHQERIGESIFLFTPRNVKVSSISGKSYKTTNETVVNSHDLASSFAESLWGDDDHHLPSVQLAQ